jgi:toxin ParE1/3/4
LLAANNRILMSSRRARIQLLETAEIQLSELLLYTERTWGENQRLEYSRLLMNIMDMLAETPDVGRRGDEISAGLRSYPVDSHVINYWHEAGILFIARILHQRQRPPRDVR